MKIGGQIKITYEMLASVFGLPEGCQITHVESDTRRDLAIVKFSADKIERGISYQIGESMEYPNIDPQKLMLKRMIKFAKQFEAEINQDTPTGKMYRDALSEIIAEESNE